MLMLTPPGGRRRPSRHPRATPPPTDPSPPPHHRNRRTCAPRWGGGLVHGVTLCPLHHGTAPHLPHPSEGRCLRCRSQSWGPLAGRTCRQTRHLHTLTPARLHHRCHCDGGTAVIHYHQHSQSVLSLRGGGEIRRGGRGEVRAPFFFPPPRLLPQPLLPFCPPRTLRLVTRSRLSFPILDVVA